MERLHPVSEPGLSIQTHLPSLLGDDDDIRSFPQFIARHFHIAAMLSRGAFRAVRASAPRRTIARSVVRTYAAAAGAQDVKPPIAVYGLDGTYATALYTAAVKSSSLDPTANALNKLNDLLTKDTKLSAVLGTPTLSDHDKSQIVSELQKTLGTAGSSETVHNFLATLADYNRLSILKGVCDKFSEIMRAARGEIEMVVTSAQPLDTKTLQRLETAVAKSQYVGQGKKLKVTNQVKSDIVGGLVVEIGDRTIDLSVSSKIARMNKLLTDTL